MTKTCIAMLLAGGQGSRLSVLTKNIAKPAVLFCGKYRIIDFALSNCVNSGIDTVGVLTQYQPLELNTYIGSGQPWDLDLNRGGVAILPPYMTSTRGNWYKGTADAVLQNINFIECYNLEYLLVLSGDHVYKMNYNWMLREHMANKSDCTIAVVDVPIEEAPRFGIMNLDVSGRITEFEEKPENPKSNKASMGIYIFNWNVLKKELLEDANDKNSKKDFGRDIIPKMLGKGFRMYGYEFKGYWKDVGTIESYWEAHMDAIHPESGLFLHDTSWSIYTRNPTEPPLYASGKAVIRHSMVSEGSAVYGSVSDSVIFYGVRISENACVRNSVILPGSVIGEGAEISYSILAENVVVSENAKIGELPVAGEEKRITVIGKNAKIPAGAVVPAGEIIETETVRSYAIC